MKDKKGNALAIAYIIANAAINNHGFYVIHDDMGHLVVDPAGKFFRVYDGGRLKIYKSGRFSTADKLYGCVSIYIKGRAYTVRQHVLMACLVYGDRSGDGLVVGHMDSVPWNNNKENLEWVTTQENNSMTRLLKELNKEYPGRYTLQMHCWNGSSILTARGKIEHANIDNIKACMDDRDALDKMLVHVE